MRDVVLLLGSLVFLPLSFAYPATGALCWAWFSMMSPHREVFGFAEGQPFNSIIALATLAGWLFSAERKRWSPDLMPWLMLAWFVWMTLNSMFAPFQEHSWHYWDRVMRILALIFLIYFLITTKARIHGMIWILAISLGYYGVKGGMFSIATGGTNIVYGPPDSMISDNNHLAAAMVMLLPLLNYLRMYSRLRILQLGLIVAIGLAILMVLGSYSRGGMIALTVTLGFFWLRSRNKIVYAVAGAAIVGAALNFMPESFWNRLNTLNDVGGDTSFQGRVTAWEVAWRVAIDRFPFGAGFYAPELAPIFNAYFPGVERHAAHSIYFQVLGEHGFIGLALYVAILLLALHNTGVVIRQTRDRADLRWAYDLANMTRVGLIGFYVGGAALSMAYFDGYLVLIALMSTLRELTASDRVGRRVVASPSGPVAPPQRLAATHPAAMRCRPQPKAENLVHLPPTRPR